MTDFGETLFVMLGGAILLLAVGGWIANIVKLLSTGLDTPTTLETVLRIVGVFAAPIGAVMGFI